MRCGIDPRTISWQDKSWDKFDNCFTIVIEEFNRIIIEYIKKLHSAPSYIATLLRGLAEQAKTSGEPNA